MLFAISCTDKPDSLELRKATRPEHLEHLRRHLSRLVQVGPLLDDAGNPRGSLLIVEAAGRAEAEALAAADPYARAGLFAAVHITPYRQTIKDGAFVG